jgi:anti-sigma factor RsiW
MSHREAVDRLSVFASGELDAATASSLEQHVGRCPRCREWLEMHRLLEGALGDEVGVGGEHPDSDLLALCAVRPEELFETDRADLRQHLDRCATCRQEVDLLRAAVHDARPAHPEPVSIAGRMPRFRAPVRRVLLAAGLCILALGLGAVYLSLVPGVAPLPDGPAAPGGAAPAEQVAEAGESDGDRLSDLELEDAHLIESDRSLTVTNVKVKPGARVTFRVGEVAAFGDGFQISDGGAVVVETRKPTRRETL